jgi:hypothetical protein
MDPLTKISKAGRYPVGRIWVIPAVLIITLGVIGGSASLAVSLNGPKKMASDAVKILTNLKSSPVPVPPLFQISDIQGGIHKTHGADETAVANGETLVQGDQISTDSDGGIIMSTRFNDRVRVDQNTQIIITEYSDKGATLELKKGRVFIKHNNSNLFNWTVFSNGVAATSDNGTWLTESNEAVNIKVFANQVKIVPNSQAGVVVQNSQVWTGIDNKVAQQNLADVNQDSFLMRCLLEEAMSDPGTLITAVLTPTVPIQPSPSPTISPTPEFIITPAITYPIRNVTPASSIKLSIGKGLHSILLDWVGDENSANSFMTLWSEKSNPTFPLRPGDRYHLFEDKTTRHDEIGGLDFGTVYYFRVCSYNKGKCEVYSNEVSIQF